jgi:hypothetical protein
MVLSYTRPNPPYAFQASDRLLTDPSNQDPLDPKANKSVVFFARGSLVVLGYSGRAVVDFRKRTERTTDHWIADQLCGEELGFAPFMMGTPQYEWDLGLALRSLRAALEADGQFAEQGVDIVFCGQQWRRGRPERGMFPVRGSLKPAGGARYELTQVRGRVGSEGWFGLDVAGGELPDGEALLRSLMAVESPEAVEQLLVDAIRDAASRSELIGTDCMVVRIGLGGVWIRYDGRRPTVGPQSAPGTPVPWIVTPGTVCGPMVSGSPELTVHNIPIRVEVPANDSPGEVVGPGKTPGSVVTRFVLAGVGPYASRYGHQPPDIPPPPVDEPSEQ